MKKAVSMIIALVLVVLITIVAAASAYYWMVELQSEMQGGTLQYQKELTEHVTGRLSIVAFQHGSNTNNAKVVMENSGSRKLENIGSPEDSLIVTTKTSSCDIHFNGSNCDACPFDLDVNEVKEINIDFAGTNCANIKEGIEYTIFFALSDGQVQSNFIPALTYDIWIRKFPSSTKPSSRSTHAMATIYDDDKAVLFGGWDSNVWDDETWVYDSSENTWTKMSPASSPRARYGTTMAGIDGTDKSILFGGYTAPGSCDGSGERYCNGTWIYDLSDDSWTLTDTPAGLTARYSVSMATIDGDDKVVMFGGQGSAGNCDNSGVVRCNGTWVYDLSDDSWTLMKPDTWPSARSLPGLSTIYNDDKVVLFGGAETGTSRDNETWVYDYSDNTWTQMNPSDRPSSRTGEGMASKYGMDEIILFSGNLEGGASNDNETWEYTYSKNQWLRRNPVVYPNARTGHAMAAIYGQDYILLFGGLNNTVRNDETWIYLYS